VRRIQCRPTSSKARRVGWNSWLRTTTPNFSNRLGLPTLGCTDSSKLWKKKLVCYRVPPQQLPARSLLCSRASFAREPVPWSRGPFQAFPSFEFLSFGFVSSFAEAMEDRSSFGFRIWSLKWHRPLSYGTTVLPSTVYRRAVLLSH